MPVEPDLLPDEPSRAAAACSLLVLKVMSKPSLSAVGGSGSTKSTGFYLSLLVLKVKSKPSLSAVGGSGSTKRSTGFYLSSRSFEK